jgi:hypothetical protein
LVDLGGAKGTEEQTRNNGCGGTRTAVDPVGLVEAVNQGQAERAAEDPGGRRKEQLKT